MPTVRKYVMSEISVELENDFVIRVSFSDTEVSSPSFVIVPEIG